MNSGRRAGLRLTGRIALVALVVGTAVTTSSTERVTASLVLAGAIGWSFVPFLQLLTGMRLIRGSHAGRTTLLERYFSTGWPWALWILALHAAFVSMPTIRRHGFLLTLTAVVPMLWTVRLLFVFCRDELELDRKRSGLRTIEHQVATYGLALVYVWVAVALWPRIVRLLA